MLAVARAELCGALKDLGRAAEHPLDLGRAAWPRNVLEFEAFERYLVGHATIEVLCGEVHAPDM